MNEHNQHLDALKDIQRIMQRSSRFISLSGLSGMAAGLCALIGSWLAKIWIDEYYRKFDERGFTGQAFQQLKLNLAMIAMIVLIVALLTAFYFTWRRAGINKLPVWDHTSRALVINMLIPLIAGALFILSLLQHNDWWLVTPSCLIFYGLSLVNGSKYTFSVIRYLGLLEIILGLVNTQFISWGLYFWAVGFGILHIIYGFIMWWNHERGQELLPS